MLPRVDEFDILPLDLEIRALLGTELVDKVVLVLFAKVVEAVLEIVLDDINGNLSHSSLLSLSLLLVVGSLTVE